MPLLYAIPPSLEALVSSGQAQLIGAIIKDVGSGQILGHVQQTQGFVSALAQAGGSIMQSGFSPLGAIEILQNQHINSALNELQEGMGILQSLQLANMALTGVGIGVSIAGFAVISARLNAIENHLTGLREDVREIGRMIQTAELRRLFSEIRAALKDLDGVAARSDHLRLASSLQRDLSTHVSVLSDLLNEAMNPGNATSLSNERLDAIWTLASAKWLCEEAELRSLFISEDLEHAGHYAERYQRDNLNYLNSLNPDALARLVAANGKDLMASISLRRDAAKRLHQITEGFSNAVENLGQQQSLARALVDGEVSGRAFIQAASSETESPFLLVTPATSRC